MACVFVGNEDEQSAGRDIIVHRRGSGAPQRMSELHSSFMPLHFTLMFPYGEPGWHPAIPLAGQPFLGQNTNTNNDEHVTNDDEGIGGNEDGDGGEENGDDQVRRTGRAGSTRVTQAQFASFYMFKRPTCFNTILLCGRLFQEYLVDFWAQTETNRLRFIRQNQETLRADSYAGVMDAVEVGVHPRDIGQRVILPSTFAGSPRQMHALYQDAMAIVADSTKPDLFITMTCNPLWQDIQLALEVGQTAQDRPDIVARVFRLKLSALQDEIFKKGIFGTVSVQLYMERATY